MPIKTRAAVCFATNEPLTMCELDLADPSPKQVMIRFLATGICHSDLHVLDGSLGMEMPMLLGHEGIAEVIALGEGVTGFAVGERVMPYLMADCGTCEYCRSGKTNRCVQLMRWRENTAFSYEGRPVIALSGIGSFAEKSVVYADMLVKVPEEAQPDLACCIACGVTTGMGAALISAKVDKGASVAVFGSGGVGISAIQGSALAGATTIIAVDLNDRKEAAARAAGATHFINPSRDGDAVEAIRKIVPLGVDFAFECVGSPVLLGQAIEASNLAWGTSVAVGIMKRGTEIRFPFQSLIGGRRLIGSYMGGAKRADVRRFVEMFVAGEYRLDSMVSHRLAHREINRGFDMMKSGESIRSVVVY